MTPPRPLEETFYRRLVGRLQVKIEQMSLDGILLLDRANVIYLTGFHHIPSERPIGVYVPSAGDPTLFAPLLEKENARTTWVEDIRCYEEFPGWEHPVLWMLRMIQRPQIAVDTLSADLFERAIERHPKLKLSRLVEEQRYLKEPEELDLIRTAAHYADACLEHIYAIAGEVIRQGRTELDILEEGVKAANQLLASTLGDAFTNTKTVVVGTVHTGARAALPHGRTLRKKMGSGETLIAGIGASVGGYHAESAVTLTLGEMTDDQRRCLEAAQACNDAAVAALKPGTTCSSVNDTAMAALREAGFDEYIRHRVGHGMGVQSHEAPWLAPGDKTPLAIGMVFSNEPGIYRPGLDGYRTINTMILTRDGVEIPSTFQLHHPIEMRTIAL